jgi:hypothetical protein
MAEKRTEPSSLDPSSQEVVKLLTSILEEFRKQVQSKTPPSLTVEAQKAVDAFKEITDALDVKAVGSSSPPR